MAFATPKENQPGGKFSKIPDRQDTLSDWHRVIQAHNAGPKPTLADGQRCGLCATTDPAEFAECGRQICFAEAVPAPSTFSAPRELVSAYALAARYQAAADALDWEQDELRGEYLKRARALRTGDSAEVPDEDI